MPDYPVAEKMPERLRAPSGLAFSEITLEAALEGKLRMEDLRVTADALELQAQVAERAGRRQLAENLRRAAELVSVPDDRILAMYNALRPGRASSETLLQIAAELESRYQAPRCAAFVREAAELTSPAPERSAC